MTPSLILITLLAYGGSLLLIGRLATRRSDNRHFFTAGRKAAWYRIWPAMISAAMSGITFVSVPGSVAADGFTYLQMVAGFTVGQLLIAFWLVPLFYRLQLTSIYEYFDRRFGTATHRTCGWLFLLSKLASASLKLAIVCIVLQQLLFAPLGLPFWLNTLCCVALVWGYTRRGGVGALIPADWLKTGCMIAALGGTIWAIVAAMGESIETLWQAGIASPMTQIWCFDPASDRFFWRLFPAGIVLLLAMTGLDQELMQRNLACRSAGDAQKNILLTAVSQAVVIFAFLVLGWLLYHYAAFCNLPQPEKADQLFAAVAVAGGLPVWVGVLFIVGFAAGSLSAGGAALTALTTSAMVDLRLQKGDDEVQSIALRHRVHLLLALTLAGLVLLFGYGADESVINLIYRVAGYTYGPILGLFLFGQWTRWQIDEKRIVPIVFLAPLLSAIIQYVAIIHFNHHIGFELLLLNTLLTMIGLWLIRRRGATV